MKKKIIGILIALLCLPISSCNNSKDDSNITVIESKDCYKTISVNIDNKNYRYPSFVEDIERNEKEFHFIFDYTELEEVFEYSTKKEVEDYFDKDLFDDNFVLVIARNDEYTKISYNNLYIEERVINIEANLQSNNSKDSMNNKKLDYLVIPREDINNKYKEREYLWKINNLFVGISKQKNDEILTSFLEQYGDAEKQTSNDFYIKHFYGIYNDAYAVYVEGEDFHFGYIYNNVIVANYTFIFDLEGFFDIYKNGKFYNLEIAYNQGIISNDDISSLYNKYVKNNIDFYK